ncbi:MAG: polysaccharide biosynthesis C-terminal domain-containing protein [Nanoarchaeota archaeon]
MIKKLWNYGRKDSMIRDSILLFSTTMTANFGAFLFHLFMGRFLGPSSYGALGVLLSMIYLIGVPVNVIQTIITKFVSQFKANNEIDKINSLVRKSSFRLVIYASIVFFLGLFTIPFLSNFLRISATSILILSPVVIFVSLLPILRGTFQGLQKFNHLALNLFLEVLLKLGLGILFVYAGWHLNGAILAITLSFFFPITIAFIPLRKYYKSTKEIIETRQIYKYAYPVLIAVLFLTMLYSIDLFLVKHFFDETLAGFYAAVSIMGKVIFFASLPISLVMFPKSVEIQTKRESTGGILKKALFLVGLISISITIFYFIFPLFALKLLFGREYISIYNIMGYNILALFGLIITMFSFIYILSLYNLSINRTKFTYFVIFANVLEVGLIYFFHNSLIQVALILSLIMALLLVYMLFYTYRVKWLNSQ